MAIDEKHLDSAVNIPETSIGELEEQSTFIASSNRLQDWANRLDVLFGLEARGIERVPEAARARKVTKGDYMQMFIIWFAINCTANNMTLGVLGPVSYSLGFVDSIVYVHVIQPSVDAEPLAGVVYSVRSSAQCARHICQPLAQLLDCGL
jgi:hypothetical protein